MSRQCSVGSSMRSLAATTGRRPEGSGERPEACLIHTLSLWDGSVEVTREGILVGRGAGGEAMRASREKRAERERVAETMESRPRDVLAKVMSREDFGGPRRRETGERTTAVG